MALEKPRAYTDKAMQAPFLFPGQPMSQTLSFLSETAPTSAYSSPARSLGDTGITPLSPSHIVVRHCACVCACVHAYLCMHVCVWCCLGLFYQNAVQYVLPWREIKLPHYQPCRPCYAPSVPGLRKTCSAMAGVSGAVGVGVT